MAGQIDTRFAILKVNVECTVCIGPPLEFENGGQATANERHEPKEIVQILRQVDVIVGLGKHRVDGIRGVLLAEQTDCRERE